MKLKKSILFTFLSVCLFTFSKSQTQDEIYRTHNGGVAITMVINDTVLVANSNHLFIFLNYETSEISIKLDLTTLRTGVDSIDNKIRHISNCDWVYKGKLSIPHINLTDNDQKNITTEGTLNGFAVSKVINAEGTMERTYGGIITCVLSLTFKINLREIGVYQNELELFNENIQIDILQSLLTQD